MANFQARFGNKIGKQASDGQVFNLASGARMGQAGRCVSRFVFYFETNVVSVLFFIFFISKRNVVLCSSSHNPFFSSSIVISAGNTSESSRSGRSHQSPRQSTAPGNGTPRADFGQPPPQRNIYSARANNGGGAPVGGGFPQIQQQA